MGEQWQEGGDAACWLGRVCAECGRVPDDADTTVCPSCGAAVAEQAAGTPQKPSRSRRDRDEEGRARNARPRDGLGRPLPYEAEGVERQPEGIERSPSQALTEAQELLDTGMPFHAHEVFEDSWKTAAEPEQGLWRGLAQLAVGLTHAARGNAKGGQSLLRRGADNIGPYADEPPHGIDVIGLARWARGLADELETRESAPAPEAVSPRLV